MKKQPLTQQEKIDRDYKQLSNCLSRIIQVAYEEGDRKQLSRLKAWHNLIGLAIEDIKKDKEDNNDSMS
tara:strand:+ start:336 stop:542 length:207 start_codon:yes stop_codon:yes gene_type:complete